MKPARPGEDGVPIEIARPRLGDGAVRAVVDHLSRALARALFQKVNAQPLAAARDLRDADAEPAQFVNRPLSEFVRWQPRHKLGTAAELGYRDRHVCLRAAKRD